MIDKNCYLKIILLFLPFDRIVAQIVHKEHKNSNYRCYQWITTFGWLDFDGKLMAFSMTLLINISAFDQSFDEMLYNHRISCISASTWSWKLNCFEWKQNVFNDWDIVWQKYPVISHAMPLRAGHSLFSIKGWELQNFTYFTIFNFIWLTWIYQH